jgi:dipeptidase
VCDTLVALKGYTKGNVTIFAKNSDREPNEAQVLEYIPPTQHTEEKVKTTYLYVEQVDETYGVLISRPFWMWGAEMGVNEHGVAIGNEAVFTREKYADKGLTGMDLLRLALERSRTAKEALEWITGLLEEYGQGGNCSYFGKMFYHNSFIIADPREAWVLETVGKHWVAERVKDVRTISNALSIGEKWDLSSDGLEEYMKEKNCGKSFKDCFSDRVYTWVSKGRERQQYTQKQLENNLGKIDFFLVARIMRSHSHEPYDPSSGSNRDICMHAGGFTRPSQTASSMIALLFEDAPLVFATGTSLPCISMYKPVFLNAGLPDLGPKPASAYDGGQSIWWRHEMLARKLVYNYPRYAPRIASELQSLERDYYEKALEAREGYLQGKIDAEALKKLTAEAFERASTIEEKYIGEIDKGRSFNVPYMLYWRKTNKKANI